MPGRCAPLAQSKCYSWTTGASSRSGQSRARPNGTGRGARLITSQVPVDRWHDLICNPNLVDAILNCLVQNTHRIQLRGDSVRRKRPAKPFEA